MVDKNRIREKLYEIQANISESAAKVGRDSKAVRLMAVTKTKPEEIIRVLIALGVVEIGENYPDETFEKKNVFENAPETVRLNMIGHCQSRKVKIVAELFDMFQSLDRLEIGLKLNRALEKTGKIMPVLLELNTGAELSKNGWVLKGDQLPDSFLGDLEKLQACSQLRIEGLMTLPPYTEKGEENRDYFANMRKVLERLNSHYGTCMQELSMGTSSDYQVAVEEGATYVRIGTLLVGPREK